MVVKMLAVNEAKCSATEASLGLPDFLICLKNPGLATSGTQTTGITKGFTEQQ